MKFLLKRFRPEGRKAAVIGWVIALINGLAGGVISYTSGFDKNLLISGVVIALMTVLFGYFKLYRLYFGNILPVHIGALLYANIISSHLLTPNEYETDIGMVMVYVSRTVLLFMLLEVVFRLLMLLSDKTGDHPENFKWALLSSFPLFFTVNFYLPSETYIENYKDFYYRYIDFAPYLAVRTVVFTVVAASVLSTFAEKRAGIFMRVLSGLMFGVYAQYMFMNSGIRTVAGDPIDWESLTGSGIVNMVIWAVLLFLPFAAYLISVKLKGSAKKPVGRAPYYLSGFIGAVEFISVIVLMLTTEADLLHYNFVGILSNEEQFTISKNQNIFTLVIDMGDVNMFEEEMKNDPASFECLKDFTFYDNCSMTCDSTNISLPSMLTGGEVYDTETLDQWHDEVWSSERAETFYSRLHENNYRVNMFGDFQYDYLDLTGKADNVIKAEGQFNINRLLFNSIDNMSGFRYMPLLIKQFVEPDWSMINHGVVIQKQCYHSNSEILNNLRLKLSDNDSNYFIIEHILGMHWHGWWANGKEGSMDQTKSIVNNYIQQFKELGKYDDSVIIITADHGVHAEPDDMPIFYIKRAGESHDAMQISHAPIQLLDFQATCLDLLGLEKEGDEEMFGRSIFDIGEDEERERLVFQREQYEITGDPNAYGYNNPDKVDMLWGYYYTGDRYDLAKKEEFQPPDVVHRIVMGYDG